jgi:hypothetical protein
MDMPLQIIFEQKPDIPNFHMKQLPLKIAI